MMEPGCEHVSSGRFQDFDDVQRAASGGDDVLHDHGGSPGLIEKPRRRDIVLVAGSRSVKMMACAECAGRFMTDDQAAQRRRHHGDHRAVCQLLQVFRHQPSQFFRGLRMLQYQSALQVLRAMETAGEPEVAFQVRSGGAEQFENGCCLRRHKGLL